MSKRVFIAGHTGMVGRALQRVLSKEKNIDTLIHSKRLDYTQETNPTFILENYQPDTVVLCAAKVGGIHANNTQRADFIYENLAIQLNWIRAAHLFKLKKFIVRRKKITITNVIENVFLLIIFVSLKFLSMK